MKKAFELKSSNNPRIPQPVAPFYHVMPLQIRFIDIDMLGHLNNTVYLTFMDLAKAHYFNDVLSGKVDWHNINVAVVNININYYEPTYLDSNICAITAVTRISEHSITMEQRIVDTNSGSLKCMATTIMAGFDVKTATSRPIAPEWRQAIEEYEGRSL